MFLINRKEYISYITEKYGEVAESPFESDPSIIVFRHHNNRKWFSVVMTVPKSKFGFKDKTPIDIINVKCSQEIIPSLWQEKGIYPAYHMNKNHWLSIFLDGCVDVDTLKALTEISYNLTDIKIKKKQSKQ